MQIGWIKLHRSLLEWEWYDDTNTVRLFLHLLLTANYEPKKWRGETIEPGQIITSYQKLAEQTGLGAQQVRTAINKLKLTSNITSESTNNYTLITVCNWDKYQDDNKQHNKRITNEQQTDNKRITTTKEYKKERSKEYIGDFESFWKIYPRKDGSKSKAQEKYLAAIKSGVNHEELQQGLEKYIEHIKATGTEKQFIAHGATWLHQKRWEAEYETQQPELLRVNVWER